MFARAGLSGRILRNSRDGRGNSISLHPFLARPKKKTKTKCYCYVPFVWQALVAILVGLGVLVAGSGMTTMGYYRRPLAPDDLDNSTDLVSKVNTTSLGHLHNLAYAGPVLMGVGCFVIVVSCVHVCEMRDQKIKEFEERRKAEEAKRGKKKRQGKNKIYDVIIKQLKSKEKEAASRASGGASGGDHQGKSSMDVEAGSSSKSSRSKHKEILKGFLRRCSALSVTSTKSEYSNISVALRKIPMDIFTVDVDGNKDTSLQPIILTSRPFGSLAPLTTKYPSDPCLTKSVVRGKRKPLPWLSQPRPPDDAALTQGRHSDLDPLILDEARAASTQSHHPAANRHSISNTEEATVTKEAADTSSPAIPSSSNNKNTDTSKDSPSNVIVHQASIHYDCEGEQLRYDCEGEQPAGGWGSRGALEQSSQHQAPATSDDVEDSGAPRCDTRLSVSGVSPVISLSRQDSAAESDSDSLFLDDIMLKSFDSKKPKPSPSSTAETSETRLADLENWEGERVLREWREAQTNNRPVRINTPRRATIPNGEALPFIPPNTSSTQKPRPPTSSTRTGNRSSRKGSGILKDPQQKMLRVRTDPRASELTVRVTQVPYSNNLNSTVSGPGSRVGGSRSSSVKDSRDNTDLQRAPTNPDLHRNPSSAKRKPVCDLHNKQARTFRS